MVLKAMIIHIHFLSFFLESKCKINSRKILNIYRYRNSLLHKHIFHKIFINLLKIYKSYLFMQFGIYLSKSKRCIVISVSVSFWANRLKSSVMSLKYSEVKNYIHLKVIKVKGHALSWPCILCTKSIIWTNNKKF